MSNRDLIHKFNDMGRARDYAAMKLFQSVPASQIPPANQTFYLRPRSTGLVYEIARDTVSGQVKTHESVQERSFIAWDRGQLWCFVQIKGSEPPRGLLCHPESSHYLTVKDNQLRLEQSYGYADNPEDNDLFEYNSLGEWVHVQSGYRLSYISGCGYRPGHDKETVGYDFDVVPSFNVMSSLLSKKIFWSNTNESEILLPFF